MRTILLLLLLILACCGVQAYAQQEQVPLELQGLEICPGATAWVVRMEGTSIWYDCYCTSESAFSFPAPKDRFSATLTRNIWTAQFNDCQGVR